MFVMNSKMLIAVKRQKAGTITVFLVEEPGSSDRSRMAGTKHALDRLLIINEKNHDAFSLTPHLPHPLEALIGFTSAISNGINVSFEPVMFRTARRVCILGTRARDDCDDGEKSVENDQASGNHCRVAATTGGLRHVFFVFSPC